MKYLLTLIIVMLSGCIAGATPTVQQAAALYEKEDYQGARECYKEIIRQNGSNAALLYNLGNTYVKSGQPGYAMVCYQEALAMDPVNTDILNNIRYLSGKVEDNNRALFKGRKLDITPDEPDFMRSVQTRISEAAGVDTYGGIALGAFVLMLVGIAVYIFVSEVRWRKAGFFGAIACLVLTIMFNIFAYTARNRWNNRGQAVITTYEAQIYPEPSTTSTPKVPGLKEGTVIDVQPSDTQKTKGWVKVRLNADYNGWMQAADLHLL